MAKSLKRQDNMCLTEFRNQYQRFMVTEPEMCDKTKSLYQPDWFNGKPIITIKL